MLRLNSVRSNFSLLMTGFQGSNNYKPFDFDLLSGTKLVTHPFEHNADIISQSVFIV